MSQPLRFQAWPGLDEPGNCVIRGREKKSVAARERLGWFGITVSTRPAKEWNVEKVEVMLEMTGDATVADDTDRSRAVRRYLSHGSGPPSTKSLVRVLVAVLSNRRHFNLRAFWRYSERRDVRLSPDLAGVDLFRATCRSNLRRRTEGFSHFGRRRP